MTDTLLRDGKLEQACGACGRWEAAGFSCTGCGAPMGPLDWYPNGDENRRRLAHERAAEIQRLAPKRPRGRPRGEVGSKPRPTSRSGRVEAGPSRPPRPELAAGTGIDTDASSGSVRTPARRPAPQSGLGVRP